MKGSTVYTVGTWAIRLVVETADLRQMAHKVEGSGWASLTAEEQACYQYFLLGIVPGDYVVYINVPTWGQCTVARVTAPYHWRWSETDFNHRLKVIQVVCGRPGRWRGIALEGSEQCVELVVGSSSRSAPRRPGATRAPYWPNRC